VDVVGEATNLRLRYAYGSPAAVSRSPIEDRIGRTLVAPDFTDAWIGLPAVAAAARKCPQQTGSDSWFSRGAELAMIIATLSQDPMVPRLAAVSSLSGSDRIVQGFSWKWSKKNRKKVSHRKARAWLWKGEYLIPGTPIPVERCDAPVLLIHGLKDTLWKAKRSKRLERRLKAAGKHVETFYMADEAHILSMLAVNRVTARLVAFLDKVLP
jgi:pimeloyl-ACP methyl ester carboxylesterase